MSAFAFINGTIHCEHILDSNPFENLSDALLDISWHQNPNGDYLFSFGIKECRFEYFQETLLKWAQIKTQDSAIKEWYPIEVYLLITFESDSSRIDCIKIFNETISRRITYS